MSSDIEESISRSSDGGQWYTTCAWLSLAVGSVVFVTSMAALGVILGMELKQGYAVITFIVTSGSLYLISVISTVVYLYSRESHDIHGAPLPRQGMLNNCRASGSADAAERIDLELLRQLSAQQETYPSRTRCSQRDDDSFTSSSRRAGGDFQSHLTGGCRCNRCNESVNCDHQGRFHTAANQTQQVPSAVVQQLSTEGVQELSTAGAHPLCATGEQNLSTEGAQQLSTAGAHYLCATGVQNLSPGDVQHLSPPTTKLRRHQPLGVSCERLDSIIEGRQTLPTCSEILSKLAADEDEKRHNRTLESGRVLEEVLEDSRRSRSNFKGQGHSDALPARPKATASAEVHSARRTESRYHELEVPKGSGARRYQRNGTREVYHEQRSTSTEVKEVAAATKAGDDHTYANVKYGVQNQGCQMQNVGKDRSTLGEDISGFSDDQIRAWQNFMDRLPDADRAIIMGMRM